MSREWGRLHDALESGMTYLRDHHRLLTEEEECAQFQIFCELVLQGLGHPRPAADLVREIATAIVYQTDMELFEDTVPALDRWRARGQRLGVVSNAWPSLDRQYRALGLRHYFEAFVISAHLGWVKPDVRIFEAALGRLGLRPNEVLFVDDYPLHVLGARSLGLHGVVLARNGWRPEGDLP
jgi:putative hydrolase of the HAD superfamily